MSISAFTRSTLLITILLCSTLISNSLSAAAQSTALPLIGKKLPALTIENKGELEFVADEAQFKPWNSEKLTGKIRVVQHLAGRISAKAINQAFIDALKKAGLNKTLYQTTTIINLNDAIFGTSNIVLRKIKKNKQAHPQVGFVVDEKGLALKTWQLNKKSSAVLLLNESGKIIFFKDGKLNEQEINKVISQLQTETKRLAQLTNVNK